MSDETYELLTLLDEEGAEETLRKLEAEYGVLQQASPRLVVLRASPMQANEVSKVEGVRAVFEADALEAFESLEPDEVLFARGWVMRRTMPPKTRSGEGLDWDTEGFEPPDATFDE